MKNGIRQSFDLEKRNPHLYYSQTLSFQASINKSNPLLPLMSLLWNTEEILNVYGDEMLRFGILCLGHRHSAEYAVQESLIELATKRRKMDDSLRLIVLRQMTDACKKINRVSAINTTSPGKDISLVTTIMNWPLLQRVILALHYYYTCSPIEIAFIVRRPVWFIEKQLIIIQTNIEQI